MRKLLFLLACAAAVAGCSVRGPMYPGSHVAASPTPGVISGNLGNLGSFCQNAPAHSAGTYPVLEADGTLTGTSYAIDQAEAGENFGYVPITFVTAPPTTAPTSPTPAPTGSPYDVWEGTIIFSGTPHDTTECFLAASYVNRAPFGEGSDNAEAIAEPLFGTSEPESNGTTTFDTVQNFVLTLSTTSVSSGSFTLAGGGHATISVTGHGVFSNAQFHRNVEDARRRHQLLP